MRASIIYESCTIIMLLLLLLLLLLFNRGGIASSDDSTQIFRVGATKGDRGLEAGQRRGIHGLIMCIQTDGTDTIF